MWARCERARRPLPLIFLSAGGQRLPVPFHAVTGRVRGAPMRWRRREGGGGFRSVWWAWDWLSGLASLLEYPIKI
jgi:hypothetical protein